MTQLFKKKSILIFSMLTFFTFSVVAQEEVVIKENPRVSNWSEMPHYVGFSVGVVNFSGNWMENYASYYPYDGRIVLMENRTSIPLYVTPAFTFDYTYKFTKWFAFGGLLSYVNGCNAIYNNYDASIAAKNYVHFVAIAPKVRFDWLNRKYVTMYSGLAVGFGLSYTYNNLCHRPNSYLTYFVDVTFVGIKAGKKWYGLAEFSYPSAGLLKLGVGYRFK